MPAPATAPAPAPVTVYFHRADNKLQFAGGPRLQFEWVLREPASVNEAIRAASHFADNFNLEIQEFKVVP